MLKSTGAATFNPRPKRIEVVGARIMNLPGILHLILERDPFDRIAKGTKRTEYREYTPYWRRSQRPRRMKNTVNDMGHVT